jgi:hypothetical protein
VVIVDALDLRADPSATAASAAGRTNDAGRTETATQRAALCNDFLTVRTLAFIDATRDWVATT